MPSPSEAASLLRLARRTIVYAVAHRQLLEDIPHDGILGERHGVFVTLHRRGRLRGCIGVIEATEPLGDCVVRCAASAALGDPRFLPVRAEELAELAIEISLLSEPVPVSPESIVIGTHGLLVVRGMRRGLLLPQVALEHQLTHEEFLEETCLKAELARGDWRQPDTQVYAFTCEVLTESSAFAKTPEQ